MRGWYEGGPGFVSNEAFLAAARTQDRLVGLSEVVAVDGPSEAGACGEVQIGEAIHAIGVQPIPTNDRPVSACRELLG